MLEALPGFEVFEVDDSAALVFRGGEFEIIAAFIGTLLEDSLKGLCNTDIVPPVDTLF